MSKTALPAPATAPATGGIVGVLAFAGIVAAVMQTLVVPLLGDWATCSASAASFCCAPSR